MQMHKDFERPRKEPAPKVTVAARMERGTSTVWTDAITHSRNSAVRRSIVFDIDAGYIERVFQAQAGKCAISGLPIYIDRRATAPTASLDRIESHRGYIQGNVQWVHKVVNSMKLDHDEAYFIAMCKQIVEHRAAAVPLTPAQRRALAGQPHRSADHLTKPADFSSFAKARIKEAQLVGSFGTLI
jgi:hypothetical protein